MVARKISPQSLKNLYQSNKEANQLTKESIETALLFLLEKKDLRQISVSELVRKAGVSRNAFYRNYKSKEEILEAYYERTSASLKKKWQNLQAKVQKDGVQQSFVDFLHHSKEKADSSKALSNVSQWIKEKTKRD
ncbi:MULTISPECIES: TetR/AcrR family transcriptional regulator [Streptococcus]|uniref:TetR/AcrR family transcriptional regulator n=2 Tax=Streptococcus ruminantium TaxID=1917441 RepID=A0A2Z5TX84_9STRE|nr:MULTISPECIES: TetR/AcrR family transcriptional regulator [Streptococcus]MDQ8759813.1 TetR/AcrR family transcriptional regulator [Streptococcus ruminantium]MDQ8764898.1 TetR/AcrR family transcriptional regulator [Streptococcus ruminantium]MDQ8767330.1 TetR/AcrR family transcriptional regulator [Streptococcus ruminantium]MDQ8768853.1 TetR/AcrR family transcriptional regulator [Streptococcus ruminantium]MDQ8774790.1 TetR/AcrR family transcriptional regulator [Streptococcus ruminantium]